MRDTLFVRCQLDTVLRLLDKIERDYFPAAERDYFREAFLAQLNALLQEYKACGERDVAEIAKEEASRRVS